MADILPGLPDDVGLRCLALLPRSEHAKLLRVCTRWCDLVTKGLTSFHALRSSMGLTQDYLVLVSIGYPFQDLTFSEVHLSSPTPTLRHVQFRRYDPIIDNIGRWELHDCGAANIPIGPFVLNLGGCNLTYTLSQPSNRLHIFDISSGFWRLGASMQSPRQKFAWGVIDNRLYVAGGMSLDGFDVEECSKLTKRAEVYDFDADRWSGVADMPLFLFVDFYYVYKQALYVGGHVGGDAYQKDRSAQKLYSYIPLLDQWKEEARHQDTIFCTASFDVVKEFTAIPDGEVERLYMLDIQPDADDTQSEDTFIYRDLKVWKLEEETSKWNVVHQAVECIDPGECTCSDRGFVDFVSMGKKPVVLTHADDYGTPDAAAHTLETISGAVRFSELNGILRLSVCCPMLWKALVINA